MVTIKDIAQEVGVSPSTVSRALSDSPLIGAATKERVRAVAEGCFMSISPISTFLIC